MARTRAGADIITPDKAGNTPLHFAAKGGHTEMVKMLVAQGAGVEKRNGSRLTAYDVATDHVVRQYLLPLQLKVKPFPPLSFGALPVGLIAGSLKSFCWGVEKCFSFCLVSRWSPSEVASIFHAPNERREVFPGVSLLLPQYCRSALFGMLLVKHWHSGVRHFVPLCFSTPPF